ncbi:Protein CBG04337 [Caenorhabditis briggsae]|uniref:Protein CBG04337 n=1 Tax=Caenorhabditis briggsae TaxID=6238 RepID=A8WXA9_CAEBR|nr:Protein CBG04337 [Caenorhabditis briggsae]CAP25069.2 Protein CBG04337 [Caenorhabditis briggsae]
MTSSSGIEVTLNNADLWKKFSSPMEMILTRKIGRKMFPILEYSVDGLNPTAMYEVYLHMERMDDHKRVRPSLEYRFINNEWDDYARGDPITPIQKIKHKSGGQTGMLWMDGPISFEQIRLTNNPDLDKKDYICLQSMHKWRPVVTIRKLKNGDENSDDDEEFRMEDVWFMAVTSYQNPAIKCLNIENNNRASGFRETGNHKTNLPTRGIKRTASETFPTPLSSTSPPSKKNSNGHSPIAHHFPNPGNCDFSMMGTVNQCWMNPYQNVWNYGYKMGQQMVQPAMNPWNMLNLGRPKNIIQEQQGKPINTIVPEFYGLNNLELHFFKNYNASE